MAGDWCAAGLEEVASPALVVDEDRVRANIRRMVEAVGGDVARLRPHLKTHKMAEVIRMQMEAGIQKFKGATIAELELAGRCGAADVLLAYQPVGPNQGRLARLRETYAGTAYSAICDDEGVLRQLSALFADWPLRVFIDVDCGMGRTGASGDAVKRLHDLAVTLPGVVAGGLHIYDGHIHAADLADRRREYEAAVELAGALVERCRPAGVIGGGSPTFPFHASRSGASGFWECSPGTTVFWDAGYGEKHPDLPYEPAAFLIARVVSKPGRDRLCLDLGHKALAAENPLTRRVRLLDLPGAQPVMHSEEHLVVEWNQAAQVPVGALIRALPIHICPTVALFSEAQVVRGGQVTGEVWKVAARDRKITL